jgi:cytochrome c oxidase subunit IV
MENPELLSGIPFLLVGVLGLGIPLIAMLLPDREAATAGAPKAPRAHFGPPEYVVVAAVLAVITLIEVALFYVDLDRGIMITTLIVLSAAKFVAVVMFFMHLFFDSKLFSSLFAVGFALAAAVFAVVIATISDSPFS